MVNLDALTYAVYQRVGTWPSTLMSERVLLPDRFRRLDVLPVDWPTDDPVRRVSAHMLTELGTWNQGGGGGPVV